MAKKSKRRSSKRPPSAKKKPPLPKKHAPPPPRKKSSTGFAAIVRGVAEAAVDQDGIGLGPDIEVSQRDAGRETMAAIEEEVASSRPAGVRVTTRSKKMVRTAPRGGSMPEISIDYRPGGRETMAAIEAELGTQSSAPSDVARPPSARSEPATGVRERRVTLGFENRPVRDERGRLVSDSAPEVITVEEGPVGRSTLDAIAEEARDVEPFGRQVPFDSATMRTVTMDVAVDEIRDDDDLEATASAAAPVIHELVTFVVEGFDLDTMESQEQRRAFVATHLMQRLPVWSSKDIARVDLTPAQNGRYAVLQIWCKLSAQVGE